MNVAICLRLLDRVITIPKLQMANPSHLGWG